MATRLYMVANGAAAGAAAPVIQATGTAVRTMMQIGTPATASLEIIEWGISFNGSAAATPGTCELIVYTGGKTTTGTNYVAADISKLSFAGNGLASNITIGTADSAWSSAGSITEVTPTGPRMADVQLLPPTAPYIKQFPLERGPEVNFSEFVRIRMTFGATVSVLSYIVYAE